MDEVHGISVFSKFGGKPEGVGQIGARLGGKIIAIEELDQKVESFVSAGSEWVFDYLRMKERRIESEKGYMER